MKRWLISILLLGQLLCSLVAFAAPQVPTTPTTSFYVQDFAQILTPQTKANINALGEQLHRQTKAQIVVVTIKSLEGNALEDYSLELFRKWQIGDREKNNGVLLLVAVNDRKSRIEVGYGLEGVLPDGLTGRIQDEFMLPYFKQNQYDKGINNAYNALAQLVAKEYKIELKDATVTRPAKANKQLEQPTELPAWAIALLAIGFVGLMIIDQIFLGGFILQLILSILLRGGGRGGGGSSGGGYGGGSGGGGGSSRSW